MPAEQSSHGATILQTSLHTKKHGNHLQTLLSLTPKDSKVDLRLPQMPRSYSKQTFIPQQGLVVPVTHCPGTP